MPKAKEIQASAVAAPTVDQFMDRDPKTLSNEDLKSLIGVLRREHQVFLEEERAKKDK